VQLDSANEASILSAAKELEGEAVDLLINNAGILSDAGLAETTKDDLLKQFEVNTVGPFLVTRAFIPHLKAAVAKNGAANVVQMSSFLGSIQLNDGSFGAGVYGYRASKAAINMINASLAIDLKDDGVAAVVLHPGYVATEINGHQGTISTDESVDGLISVIGKLTIADTGKFFNYTGASLPW
jgi:RNA-binding protein with serine-rich domain 1